MLVFERVVLGLRREIFRAARKFSVAGRDHSAAAGRDDLVAIEAEARELAELSDGPPAIPRSAAFGRVLDHGEIEFAREREDRIHVHGMSEDVHGNDRLDAPARAAIAQRAVAALAALAQKLGGSRGIHLPKIRLGIDEHRPRVCISDGIRGRDERERRDEHFVVRLHARDEQRNVQRRRAIHRRDRVRRAGAAREIALEAIDVAADRRDPAGVETVFQILPLVPADRRDAERNESRSRRGAGLTAHRCRCDTSAGFRAAIRWSRASRLRA